MTAKLKINVIPPEPYTLDQSGILKRCSILFAKNQKKASTEYGYNCC